MGMIGKIRLWSGGLDGVKFSIVSKIIWNEVFNEDRRSFLSTECAVVCRLHAG